MLTPNSMVQINGCITPHTFAHVHDLIDPYVLSHLLKKSSHHETDSLEISLYLSQYVKLESETRG